MQHAHRGGYNLLGSHTRDETHTQFPVESLRSEHRLDGLANHADIALFELLLASEFVVMREISKCPDDDTCHEDDTAHLLQILLAFLPCMSRDSLCRGHSIGRKLHDKWGIFAPHKPFAEDAAHHHGGEYAEHIEADDNQTLVSHVEAHRRNHYIDRQSRRTAHHRKDEHGDNARALALDSAGGHHGGHIATESHNQRDERLAMQSHLVHQFVHDESRPCHISRVLHK